MGTNVSSLTFEGGPKYEIAFLLTVHRVKGACSEQPSQMGLMGSHPLENDEI